MKRQKWSETEYRALLKRAPGAALAQLNSRTLRVGALTRAAEVAGEDVIWLEELADLDPKWKV